MKKNKHFSVFGVTLKMRIVAAVLITANLLCGMNGFAAWDGSENDPENPFATSEKNNSLEMTIVDMDSFDTIISGGAIPSQKVKGNAKYTAHWTNHASNTDLIFEKVPTDWSEIEWLEIPIYSEEISNASIAIVIRCNSGATNGGNPYLSMQIKLDWKGWKTFKLYIDKHFNKLNTPNLSDVSRLYFSAKNYGGEAKDNSDIYIDTIKAHLIDHEKPARDAKQLYDASEGIVAVYDFCKNIYVEHTAKIMDSDNITVGATTRNGISFVPETFFSKNLGAALTTEGDYHKLSNDKTSIQYQEGKIEYLTGSGSGKFKSAPFYQEGVLYVPTEAVAKELGKTTKRYDMLTIIGGPENIEKFDENEELPSLCIAEFVDKIVGVENVSDAIFDELLAKYRHTLVGDENLDVTDSYMKNFIEKAESSGKAAWENMNMGADRDKIFALFGKEKTDSTASMGNQSKELLKMAKAWGTKGTSMYHDEKLKEDILSGLQWFYENLYGEDEAQNKGWRDIHEYNWWQWAKEVPISFCGIIAIMYDYLDYETINDYFEMTRVAQKTWGVGSSAADSVERIDRDVPMAIVTRDTALLEKALGDLANAITPVEAGSGGGYQKDDLYIYHGKFPYSSGYGINQLSGICKWISLFGGESSLSFESRHKYNLMNYMNNTYYPIIFNGRAQIMFGGRNITSVDDIYSGFQVLKTSLYLIDMYGEEENEKIKTMLRRHITDSNRDYVLSMLPIELIGKLKTILDEDVSSAPIEEYQNCKVYWSGDRVVQQRGDYAVGIAMSSSRVGNYESINVDNSRGWYTGDGALYIYNNGPKQYHLDYFKNVNWARYPGTTEDTQKREEAQISLGETYVAPESFAGGVQFNNEYAAIGYDFHALNHPVRSDFVNEGYGGAQPAHTSSLEAKKAYFLFDDEVVALGTNISSNDGFNVFTMLDNRMLYENGEVNGMEDITVDGTLLPKLNSYTKSYKNVKWLHVESEGGYYFPQSPLMTINKTDKNPSFLEMWIEHGKNPKKASYAYVVLPNKTAAQTEAYTKAPDISVLANNAQVQAVKENDLNLTGYIFWGAGSFSGITVSDPVSVMVSEKDGKYTISVCDPSQTLQKTTIKLNKKLKVIDKDDIMTVSNTASQTVIELDLREKLGETFTAVFELH